MATSPSRSDAAASDALRVFRPASQDGEVFDITNRRHPRYNFFEEHWRFMLESYEGGPEYLFKGIIPRRSSGFHSSTEDIGKTNLFKYLKEGDSEYRDRMLRATRNNYSKKMVDQIRAFIARKPPERRKEGVSQAVLQFWEDVDGKKTKINDFMAKVAQWQMTFGLFWLQVDKSNEVFENAADEMEEGMPFVRVWFPFDVLDAGFDRKGRLKWILVRELVRQDDDPMRPSPLVFEYVLWEPNRVRRFRKVVPREGDKEPAFVLVGETITDLGFVPFRPVRFTDSRDQFVSPGLLDDIAYLDRKVFNNQSRLDVIINDQTFSQLAMPTDGLVLPDPSRIEGQDTTLTTRATEARQRLVDMGTKRIFLFNGNATHPPQYISPDAEQAATIVDVIAQDIQEIYRLAGLLGNVGREVRTQSGVSKAYDFDRLNKVLAFAAQELQSTERWLAFVVEAWLRPEGAPLDSIEEPPEDLVQYPENFDIMGLLEALDIAFRADEYDLHSPRADALIRKQLVQKMMPSMTREDRAVVFSQIEMREEQETEMFKRGPMVPPAPDEPGGGDPSQVRGAGGGARGPNSAQPTRPTSQQSDSSEAGNRET